MGLWLPGAGMGVLGCDCLVGTMESPLGDDNILEHILEPGNGDSCTL